MTTINYDNGCGMYYDAYDVDYAIIAIEGIYSDKDDIEFAEKLIGLIDRYWDEIALRMDKELAEEVHNDIAPGRPLNKKIRRRLRHKPSAERWIPSSPRG